MATEVRNPNSKIWDINSAVEKFPQSMNRVQKLLDKMIKANDKIDLKGDITGLLLSFPYADGYAFYQVVKVKPFQICHVPYGDAWQVDGMMIRGLRIQDAIRIEKQRRGLNALFSRKD